MLTDDQLKALDTSGNAVDQSDSTTITWSNPVGGITTLSVPTLTTSSIAPISGITVGGTISGIGSGYSFSQSACYPTSNYTSVNQSTVNITTSGIEMKEGSDIKIGERSLIEFMSRMEDRLAILVPNVEKLEKFEALRKAYDHYKLMEKLCQIEKEDTK